MNATTNEVLNSALALPELERAYIVDALLESLQGRETEVLHPGWTEELRRRSEALASGEDKAISWSEVKAEAWRRLGGEPSL